MKRGDIWTVSGGGTYTGKPRPAVILQDDRFDTDSVTVCPCTTDPTDAPLFRLQLEPNGTNGLDAPSSIMVDKITTVRRTSVRTRVGTLTDAELMRLNRAVVVFLGIAAST